MFVFVEEWCFDCLFDWSIGDIHIVYVFHFLISKFKLMSVKMFDEVGGCGVSCCIRSVASLLRSLGIWLLSFCIRSNNECYVITFSNLFSSLCCLRNKSLVLILLSFSSAVSRSLSQALTWFSNDRQTRSFASLIMRINILIIGLRSCSPLRVGGYR